MVEERGTARPASALLQAGSRGGGGGSTAGRLRLGLLPVAFAVVLVVGVVLAGAGLVWEERAVLGRGPRRAGAGAAAAALHAAAAPDPAIERTLAELRDEIKELRQRTAPRDEALAVAAGDGEQTGVGVLKAPPAPPAPKAPPAPRAPPAAVAAAAGKGKQGAATASQAERLGVLVAGFASDVHRVELLAQGLKGVLGDAGIPYEVYFAEQRGTAEQPVLNKGYLLDAAFAAAKRDTDYVVLLDAGLLPVDGEAFRFRKDTRFAHLATAPSTYDFRLPYARWCGGALLVHNSLFEEANGLGVHYWGGAHSGTEDDFCLRLLRVTRGGGWMHHPPGRAKESEEQILSRPSAGAGRFVAVGEPEVAPSPGLASALRKQNAETFDHVFKAGGKHIPADGLPTVEKHKAGKDVERLPLFVRVSVKVPDDLRPP